MEDSKAIDYNRFPEVGDVVYFTHVCSHPIRRHDLYRITKINKKGFASSVIGKSLFDGLELAILGYYNYVLLSKLEIEIYDNP